ncbi:hypothetical protein [Clostridium sp. FP1]|uniref:hypothetical protein n=1 Tax=Clostridium sp. FP1 TaxID=2724076 RepID=UPI0013E93DD2|nr:hypothetical protein [Clostridium sp. FP1]MBZ9634602.1 hypothetical protein [Clostridium sp. FP1]
MNNFVAYLNSLNNASGSNENALAESQVLSEYYNQIVVERKIADYIFNLLFDKDEKSALVLTGHAGDGKTSILLQVLKRLGYFDTGIKALQEVEEYNEKFLYIKDMSELNENRQEEMFEEFIKAPRRGVSSILISNTGPLLNTTNRILAKTYINENETAKDELIENFEVNLLSEIDRVESSDIEITVNSENFKFKVINLAKIDNSYLVGEIMEKFTKDELWEPCNTCICEKRCPVYMNYLAISNNQVRVVQFVERLYFWFADNQKRLTIRQMVSHLSYSITGNLECSEINRKISKDNEGLFKYNFANLFFGYVGTKFAKSSFNIKAIRDLNEQMFEEKALEEDYKLFVSEDYSMFDENTREVLENTLKHNFDKLGIKNKESIYMRRAFRRFYMLLSKVGEEEFNNLIGQIFSEMFPIYYELITESKAKCARVKSRVKDIVFNGLFKYLVGVHPLGTDELYLTLKKNNMDYQNVQLILGTIKKNEIKLEQEKISNNIEDTNILYKVLIRLENINFEVSYQILDYLDNINKGKVYTKLNPSYTFDLTRLKSELISAYGRKEKDDTSIRILVINNNSIKEIQFDIDDDVLYEA